MATAQADARAGSGMSQRCFQASLARLVADPSFRDRVREEREAVLSDDLTVLERRRLLQVAEDNGLAITRTLYKGFRLSKILLMLPMTCVLLGNQRLAREVNLFWSNRHAMSFYFLEESLAFCDHLERRRRDLRIAYLQEILAFERASLELKRVRTDNHPLQARLVRFRHDPETMIETLSNGHRPRAVPLRPCTLI
ncbi:MAG: hypothetical protein WBP93_02170, partial [Pyrinomonadaceae bacterium]